MIIREVEIERFRSFENVSFHLGKNITAIAGRNATQKTTLLGMIGQPFTISEKANPMYGCKTIDGYGFRSQFRDKFKISPKHDIIGEHKWTLKLHKGIYSEDSYTVKSIPRNQRGKESQLRFWNAKGSRNKGEGYIQLPVYFLSLSRIFPIGEARKTTEFHSSLTESELKECIDRYDEILSIHPENGDDPAVSIEKATGAKVFTGVNDCKHDVFTNSSGEGNVIRIILAMLSFKRLSEQFGENYKGGILLIDELDATLYGFSQVKLVQYLYKTARNYKVQVVFTTHSPIILECVNKLQREEQKRNRHNENRPTYSYECAIIYLEPDYKNGRRLIQASNILNKVELNRIIADINLSPSPENSKVKVYCEDAMATSFLRRILPKMLEIDVDKYADFPEVNLGWTNYVQLVTKQVAEFANNVIVLDGDVPEMKDFKSKKAEIDSAGNIVFLPLVIERDIFKLLKNTVYFEHFKEIELSKNNKSIVYDICFKDWTLSIDNYTTEDFKKWFSEMIKILGGVEDLFDFWCEENIDSLEKFTKEFVSVFNVQADKRESDYMPLKCGDFE